MVPSPFDCYMANRGLKTLHLRMREHQRNAKAVAALLSSSPHVIETIYPGQYQLTQPTSSQNYNNIAPPPIHPCVGLPSHPQHEVAKRQCKGFGGMVSFRIKGGLEQAQKFMQAIKVQ